MRSACAALAMFAAAASGGRAQTIAIQTGSGVQGDVTGGVTGGIVTPSGVTPPRDPRVQVTGSSRLSGVITAGDTGRPLRRATVRLTLIGGGAVPGMGMRTNTTDADGRYEFTDLPAGRYNVVASRTGYVQMSYGQKRPFAAGQMVTVQDGAATVHVDIGLPAAGVIAGRVLDEFGEPVADVFVSAVRRQFMGGERRLVAAGGRVTTNDIGEFRLHSLPPGDYFVSAAARGMVTGTTDRSGYAATYYPSTASIEAAQAVTVHAAETLSNVVVMLSPARLNRVSGIVLGADGTQARTGTITANQRDEFGLPSSSGSVRPDGSFEIGGLADGEYTLRAMVGPFQFGPGTPPPLPATAVVSIAGADLSNVIVRPVQPVVLAGRITGDPAALAALRPATMQVVAARLSTDPAGPMAPGRLRDDLTFEMTVYPGRLSLRAQGLNGLLIDAVRWHGTDVTRGFDVAEGIDGSGFEVTLTSETARLGVTAAQADGTPIAGCDVMIFTTESAWWGSSMPGRFAAGRTTDAGRFEAAALRPGSYYVVAVDGLETFRAGDPEFLETISRRARRIALTAGERADLQLVPIEP